MKRTEAQPISHSVDSVVALTGHSRPVVYDAIARGHLKTHLVGRRRFARNEDVRRWVDYLEKESLAGRPVVYRSRKSERKAA